MLKCVNKFVFQKYYIYLCNVMKNKTNNIYGKKINY